MKNTFTSILLLVSIFCLSSSIKAQPFEGMLSIKSSYKENAKDTMPSINNYKLMVKGTKAMLDQKGFGKMILNSSTNEMHVVVGEGSQPAIWKVNLSTINQLGGLLMLMKAATGQDVMTITPQTKLTATTSATTISGHKSLKYTTSDETHKGSIWISEDFPANLTAIWSTLNVATALKNSGISSNAMILKAESKSIKTGELTTMTVTPKAQTVDDKIFVLPANGQVMDITPLLTQMLQSQKPEDVQKMLMQMMPK
jgi:hypothetical protein